MVDPFALCYRERLVITNVDFTANKRPSGIKAKDWVKIGDIVIATNRHVTIAGEDRRWNRANWCMQIEWKNRTLYWPDNCLGKYVPPSIENITSNISPILRIKRSWD